MTHRDSPRTYAREVAHQMRRISHTDMLLRDHSNALEQVEGLRTSGVRPTDAARALLRDLGIEVAHN